MGERHGGIGNVLRAFLQSSRLVTIGLLVTATVGGVALPVFIVATGWLVDAVRTGDSVAGPLAVLAVVFILERGLDPVREELGRTLWRRVDERLTERVMVAMATPAGMAHVEDEGVADLVAQAQGTLTDVTPGQAAVQFVSVWMQWTRGTAALLIVAGYRWWMALGLGALYFGGYRVARWHWNSVTQILYHRTDRLRDAYYLRSVALTSDAAKETRVFGLAPWLVGDYRRRWLGVMVDVWQKRSEGWLAALAVCLLLAAAEAGSFLFLVGDAVRSGLTVGAATAVGQAVLAAAILTQYNDGHWSLGECARALAGVRALEQSAGSAGAAAGVVGGQREADGLPHQEIRFESVSFAYPGQTDPVLDNFDLTIEAGSSLALVGQNGAGKTTLVKLLARLYDPTAGRITVDGIDLRELDPTSWHKRVAAVFQDFVQFELSAYDNVAFGALDRYGDARGVQVAAGRAGANAAIERLQGGWSTMLSRQFSGGTQLSGGEWQRLALARALFAVEAGAGVLVLDEPTASLDVRGEADVYDRFLELTRGITTIIISHRFSTVRKADRIVVIEHGRIVEDGTHDGLLAAGGRYAQMYRLQASRFEDATHA